MALLFKHTIGPNGSQPSYLADVDNMHLMGVIITVSSLWFAGSMALL